MRTKIQRVLWVLFFILFSGAPKAQSATEVRFTEAELQAVALLVHPELNSLEINGRTAVFTPAPSLRFLGMEESRFQINFSGIIDLADLEFNRLRAKPPELQFSEGRLELRVPVFDQSKVLRSAFGSISSSGVVLIASLGFVSHADGAQELVLQGARMEGRLSGSGVLGTPFIINKIRNYFTRFMQEKLSEILKKPMLQESLIRGLVTWGKFQMGTPVTEVVPGSIQFFEQGIRFEVQ